MTAPLGIKVTCPMCRGTCQTILRIRFRMDAWPPTARMLSCPYCFGSGSVMVLPPDPFEIEVDVEPPLAFGALSASPPQ